MILVSGGTGLVGSRIVELLIEQGQSVKVIARGLSDWKTSTMPQFRRLGVDVIVGDLQDRRIVEKAIDGCNAIINASGSIANAEYNSGYGHLVGIGNLIDFAKLMNIQRFVHISCLGATEHSTSKYFFGKWQEEQMVKQGAYYWTIFRPSLIFGTDGRFSRALEFMVKSLPFIPVIGSGLNRIQPVSADDVAQCVVQSIYNKETTNQYYDLVGPITYTFADILKIVCHSIHGKNKPLVHIPAIIAFKLAKLAAKTNSRLPINEEMLKAIVSESVGDDSQMKQIFSVEQKMFETSLPQLPLLPRADL
jgi:NADH dehydrogenase